MNDVLISHKEQKYIQNTFRKFISEGLNHNLQKLPRINCRYPNPNGVRTLCLDYKEYGDGDDIYLKFGDIHGNGGKIIQISVLVFKNIKSGFGTLLLSQLVDIAEKYDYSLIEMHSVNEVSTVFCQKMGFEKYGNCMQISISTLRNHLLVRDRK